MIQDLKSWSPQVVGDGIVAAKTAVSSCNGSVLPYKPNYLTAN